MEQQKNKGEQQSKSMSQHKLKQSKLLSAQVKTRRCQLHFSMTYIQYLSISK